MDNQKIYFGKRKIRKNKKTPLVQKIFSNVSKKYDLMNDIMSLNTHKIWKKELIDTINIQTDDKIVDVGSGTGDLVKLIFDRNKNVTVYAVDLNKEMLNEAKRNLLHLDNKKLKFVKANAEKLPFDDNFFDIYLISFCLRNITEIDKALKEAHRVLKPNGYFYCLEFGTPNTNLINSIYLKYKKNFIPFMGKKIAKDENAYQYLSESIDKFPHKEILVDKIKKVGFEEINYFDLFDGIVNIHKGIKL